MTPLRKTTLGLLALDILAVFLCFNAALIFRGLDVPLVVPLIWPALFAIAALYLIDGYTTRTDMLSVDYTSQHLIALFAALLGTLLTLYVFQPAAYGLTSSRGVIFFAFAALAPLTLSYRRLGYARVRALRQSNPIVFIGTRASIHAFQAECAQAGVSQPLLFALTDNTAEAAATPLAKEMEKDARISLIDGGSAAKAVLRTSSGPAQNKQVEDFTEPLEPLLHKIETGQLAVHAIVLCEDTRQLLPAALSQRLAQAYFDGIPITTRERFHQTYWRKVGLYRLDNHWPFQDGFAIASIPVFEHIKRLSDILLASLGLLLSLPLMLLCALGIWLEDRGPIFFTQTRIGQDRRPFKLYKLRTMRCRPADQSGDKYTQNADPRITRIGRFLRTSRLDEFPQLLNVLLGDMSMIGPRAEWDELVRHYETVIPCYHFRHLLKPGITGWAQVNYPYGANLQDTLRKLEYDLYYIRHFSFRIDAAIILKTIHIMLFGRGR